ncbi:hypothetical protein, partial [Nocardioides soli]
AAQKKRQEKARKSLERSYKTAEKKAVSSLRSESKALEKVLVRRDELTSKLDDAKKALEELKQTSSDYAASIKNSVLDYGSITSLNSAFTSDAMIQQLRGRIDMVRRFAAVMASLREQGLNDDLYKELLSAGVEGGLAYAEALASGGSEAITEMNNLNSILTNEADALGTTGANNLYAAGIANMEGYVNGLSSQLGAVDAEAALLSQRIAEHAAELALTGARGMQLAGAQASNGFIKGLNSNNAKVRKWAKNVAKSMIKEIKDELGIASPSRVFKAIGKHTTQGLQIGLEDTRGVVKAMARVSDAMTGSFKPEFQTAAFATNGSGGTTTITINVTVPVGANPAQAGKEIKEALDAYYATGAK